MGAFQKQTHATHLSCCESFHRAAQAAWRPNDTAARLLRCSRGLASEAPCRQATSPPTHPPPCGKQLTPCSTRTHARERGTVRPPTRSSWRQPSPTTTTSRSPAAPRKQARPRRQHHVGTVVGGLAGVCSPATLLRCRHTLGAVRGVTGASWTTADTTLLGTPMRVYEEIRPPRRWGCLAGEN